MTNYCIETDYLENTSGNILLSAERYYSDSLMLEINATDFIGNKTNTILMIELLDWGPDLHDEGVCGENISWSLDDRKLSITGYGPMYDFVGRGFPWNLYMDSIEEVVISEGITRIGSHSFYWNTNIRSVSIPSTVTEIGSCAFYHTESLESIILPKRLICIEYAAFAYCCSLKNIIIPEGVRTIPDATFNNCRALSDITLPHNLESIGYIAFAYCGNLTHFTIPGKIIQIEPASFAYCSKLAYITIPNCVTEIMENAFAYCDCLTDTYYWGTAAEWNAINIRDNNNALKNATIHYSDEMITGMKVLTLPAGLKIIEEEAFSGAACEVVIIPDGCQSIRPLAFADCMNLKYVYIPASVTEIAQNAFEGSINAILDYLH